MKKIKKLLLTVVMAVIACCGFLFASGCSLFDTSVEGTYYFNKLSYTEAGMTVEIKEGEKFMGMMVLEKDFMTITLNENGTGVVSAAGESDNITWIKEGEILSMTDSDGEVQTATWSTGKIVMEQEESGIMMKIVLKK